MNLNQHFSRTAKLIAAALVAASLGGCCGPFGAHHDCPQGCYSDWSCFGYHSTCWRPWPEECIDCPSPFLPVGLSTEAVPAPHPSDAPLTLDPAAPIVPAEGNPAVPGEANPAPPAVPPLPENGQGESSRRRIENGEQYSLENLRWAPAGNP